jgi:hypothetical protein
VGDVGRDWDFDFLEEVEMTEDVVEMTEGVGLDGLELLVLLLFEFDENRLIFEMNVDKAE